MKKTINLTELKQIIKETIKEESEVQYHGVKIGDKFRQGKNLTAVVVDFYDVISVTSGELIKNICVAKLVDGLANNTFEVPFATVMRNKIN